MKYLHKIQLRKEHEHGADVVGKDRGKDHGVQHGYGAETDEGNAGRDRRRDEEAQPADGSADVAGRLVPESQDRDGENYRAGIQTEPGQQAGQDGPADRKTEGNIKSGRQSRADSLYQ